MGYDNYQEDRGVDICEPTCNTCQHCPWMVEGDEFYCGVVDAWVKTDDEICEHYKEGEDDKV